MKTDAEIKEILKNISNVNKAIHENIFSRGHTVPQGTNWSLFTSAYAIFKITPNENKLVRLPNLEQYVEKATAELIQLKVPQEMIDNLKQNLETLKNDLIENQLENNNTSPRLK